MPSRRRRARERETVVVNAVPLFGGTSLEVGLGVLSELQGEMGCNIFELEMRGIKHAEARRRKETAVRHLSHVSEHICESAYDRPSVFW